MSGGSCRDLREFLDDEHVVNAFSALVSGGKPGYKTIIEKKKLPPRCSGCGRLGAEFERFCSECGGKMIVPLTNCPTCKKSIDEHQKFCTNCGQKLKE